MGRLSSRSRSSRPASRRSRSARPTSRWRVTTSACFPNGKTVAGNRGDGVQINASSHGDLIGQVNPVSSIDYYPTADVYTSDGQAMPVSGWQGIRAADTSGQYLITGTSDRNGLLYMGRFPASAERLIRSTTREPPRRACTVPTTSATASCDWSAATRPATVKPTDFFSRARPPISRTAATTDDRESQTRLTLTFTARWATWRSATAATSRPRRTTRSFTASRRTRS